jgi:hypothetical protein
MKYKMLNDLIEPESDDFTLTIEYTDSRQDKLKGRSAFEGRIVPNANQLAN